MTRLRTRLRRGRRNPNVERRRNDTRQRITRIDAKKISERKMSKPFRIFRVFRGQIVFLAPIGMLA